MNLHEFQRKCDSCFICVFPGNITRPLAKTPSRRRGNGETHSGPVDEALHQEDHRVSRRSDGLHRLLMTGVPEVHPVHLWTRAVTRAALPKTQRGTTKYATLRAEN